MELNTERNHHRQTQRSLDTTKKELEAATLEVADLKQKLAAAEAQLQLRDLEFDPEATRAQTLESYATESRLIAATEGNVTEAAMKQEVGPQGLLAKSRKLDASLEGGDLGTLKAKTSGGE